jgi:hypothetical protein
MKSRADRDGAIACRSTTAASRTRASAASGRPPRGRLLGACFLGFMCLPRAAGAAPIMNPDNGHYYEAVARDAGISWNAANTAANARTFHDMHGHLVTITSPAENSFILHNLAGERNQPGQRRHGAL